MGDLCALADVKTWLQKTDATDDTELNRIIKAVSADIRNTTGQSMATPPAQYNVTKNGRGGKILYLHEQPVTSFDSLIVNGAAVAQSTAWNVAGWVLEYSEAAGTFWLRLIQLVFPVGDQNVQIQYHAGYATVPDDLTDLAIRTVGHRFFHKRTIAQNSRRIGDDTTTFDQSPWPKDAMSILANYTRPAVG